MPSLIGSIPLRSQTYLRRHSQFKLVVCNLQKCEKLSSKHTNCGFSDQRVRKLQRSSTDRNISIPQAVKNYVTVALNGICVHGDDFEKGIKGNIATSNISIILEFQGFAYRMLLSRLLKNLPSILIAMTRKLLSATISRTVITVS